MASLGEALDLMQGASSRYTTLVGELRHWQDSQPKREAVERWIRDGGHASAPKPQEDEATWEIVSQLAVALPDRFREERSTTVGERRPGPTQVVVNGDRWWIDLPPYGSFHGVGHPNGGLYTATNAGHLLDPRDVAVALDLEAMGTETVAGRWGIRLRGTPRMVEPVPCRTQPFDLSNRGATEFDIVVDGEYGVVLRSVAAVNGRDIDVLEFLTVAFDTRLGPEVFTFESPDGEPVRPLPNARLLTLDECRAVTSFTVFVAPMFGDLRHVSWKEPWERGAKPHVSMRWYRGDGGGFIDIDESAAAADLVVGAGFEVVDLDGGIAYAWRDRFSYACLAFVRSTTEIQMRGPVDRDVLVACASWLVPAAESSP